MKEEIKNFFEKELEKEKIFEFRDFRVEKKDENIEGVNFDLKLIGNGLKVLLKIYLLGDTNQKEEKISLKEMDKLKKIEKSGNCITILLISTTKDINSINLRKKEVKSKIKELFSAGIEIIGYKYEKNHLRRIPVEFYE